MPALFSLRYLYTNTFWMENFVLFIYNCLERIFIICNALIQYISYGGKIYWNAQMKFRFQIHSLHSNQCQIQCLNVKLEIHFRQTQEWNQSLVKVKFICHINWILYLNKCSHKLFTSWVFFTIFCVVPYYLYNIIQSCSYFVRFQEALKSFGLASPFKQNATDTFCKLIYETQAIFVAKTQDLFIFSLHIFGCEVYI